MGDSSDGEQPRADSGHRDPGNENRPADPSAGGREGPPFPSSLMGGAGMLRFAGAGMELAGSAILCAAVGYALDRYFENTTLIATALGTVFGFAAGLYRFIRMAMAANKSAGHR